MSVVCPNCNTELPDDAVFCDQCGSSLSRAPTPVLAAPGVESVCPQCGAPTIPGEAFCDSCGASLAEPAVAAEAPAVAALEPPSAPPPEPAEPALATLVQCPACNADNLPGSRYCSNCGIEMEKAEAPAAAAEPEEEVEAAPEAAAEPEPAAVPEAEAPSPTGRLCFVVRDTGAEIILPTAEGDYIIGREDPISDVFPEVDLNPYDGEQLGVSRHHAQLTIQAGLAFIQDLDSTNFTFVNRKKLTPRTPTALSGGDEVRLGKLVLTFLE